jgi:hypothetical protein
VSPPRSRPHSGCQKKSSPATAVSMQPGITPAEMSLTMTEPIPSRSAATSSHYDHQAGECRAEPPVTPTGSTSAARTTVSSQPDPQPARAAVDLLVATRTRGSAAAEMRADDDACWRERVLTTATCVGALGAALTATTGVGVILALSAGAACGAKLADAEARCRGK